MTLLLLYYFGFNVVIGWEYSENSLEGENWGVPYTQKHTFRRRMRNKTRILDDKYQAKEKKFEDHWEISKVYDSSVKHKRFSRKIKTDNHFFTSPTFLIGSDKKDRVEIKPAIFLSDKGINSFIVFYLCEFHWEKNYYIIIIL